MPRHVVLLRGINIGSRNRISMPELRAALEEAGFKDVQTYLQSGNVVLESRAKPETVARKVSAVIKDRFGLEIAVLVRTRDELTKIVNRNPLGSVAKDPKREGRARAGGSRRTGRTSRGRRPRGLRGAPADDRPLEAVGEARWQGPWRHGHVAELGDCGGAARPGGVGAE